MRHLARLPLAADGVGTISAEPGVGVATSRWLALTRSPGELQAMAAIKHVLDPDGSTSWTPTGSSTPGLS